MHVQGHAIHARPAPFVCKACVYKPRLSGMLILSLSLRGLLLHALSGRSLHWRDAAGIMICTVDLGLKNLILLRQLDYL